MIRALAMRARKRANSVWGEKLIFVEHVAEYSQQPFSRWDREKAPSLAVIRAGLHVGYVASEVGAVLEEPFHPPYHPGQVVELVGLENLDRIQGDQPDHRADLQRDELVTEREPVVIEAVLLVPQSSSSERVHRVCNRDEVLEELRGDVLVGRVGPCELESHREHGGAVEGHPRSTVGLLESAARRQGTRAVEQPDVVEAEEAAGEQMASADILAVDPPGEVQEQLLEHTREKDMVAPAARRAHLVHAVASPSVHGRSDTGEVEFIGRDLPV